jgi:hypothetical protein
MECEVPREVFEFVAPSRFLYRPNLGYDWGCYQQFLETNIWRDYDYTFFMHDDITVKHLGFVERSIELLEADHGVIGNGRVAGRRVWPNAVYAHASWKPPRHFVHDAVRGSFFATRRSSLEALGRFEVFWDPWHLTPRFGNWSLLASCAKWEHRLGERCFQFLSEEYRHSEYLEEDVRGGQTAQSRTLGSQLRKQLVQLILKMCDFYMMVYWREKTVWGGPVALYPVERVIKFIAGT